MEINSPSDHTKHSTSILSSGSSGGSPESDERLVDTTVLNSSVKVYVEDQREVGPDKVMSYMFMLGRGVHKDIPKDIDISSVELLKKALDIKVLKKKAIISSKPMLLQELRRRNPDKKTKCQ